LRRVALDILCGRYPPVPRPRCKAAKHAVAPLPARRAARDPDADSAVRQTRGPAGSHDPGLSRHGQPPSQT
jgi:hypothetical protein